MTDVRIVSGDKMLCIICANDELEITPDGKSVRELLTARKAISILGFHPTHYSLRLRRSPAARRRVRCAIAMVHR